MRHLNRSRVAFLGALLLGAIWTPSAWSQTTAQTTVGDRAATLVLGRITSNPKKRLPQVGPMAVYLSEKLRDVGIQRHQVKFAENVQSMATMLEIGEVDVLSETALTTLSLEESGHAEILLREWKRGVAEYHSVFFAKNNNGVGALEDLVGRKIAFEDAGSTSAFLIPISVIKRAGLELVELRSIRETVPDGKIGYAFAGSERNLITWVTTGLADAGAFSNNDWESGRGTPTSMREELSVFHQSPPVMRSALLVRRGLDPRVKDQLKTVLLNADQDPKARDALSLYFDVSNYDIITPDVQNSLEQVRALTKQLSPSADP